MNVDKVTIRSESELDLREKPDASSKVTGKIPTRQEMELLDEYGVWVMARSKFGEGWFRSSDDEGVQRLISSLDPNLPVSLFHPGSLDALQAFVSIAFQESNQQNSAIQCLEQMLVPAMIWQDLAGLAHGYLAGNPVAESRFVDLAEGFALTPPDPTTPCVKPFPQELVPTSGGFPAFPHRFPNCFFNKFAFSLPFTALRRLATEIAGQSQFEPDAVFSNFAVGLTPLIDGIERLETIYGAARGLNRLDRPSFEKFGRVFATMTVQPISEGGRSSEPSPNLNSNFPLNFPFPGSVPLSFCRGDRWRESERALSCICSESYEVEQIVNLDRNAHDSTPLIGEGCIGDLVEISGRGFGDSREWAILGRKSEVVFSGSGTRGVPVNEEDYVSWSDERLQVRVPENTRNGRISLRVLCGDGSDRACGVRLRIADGNPSDRQFTFPPRPSVETFEQLGTFSWRNWCTPVSLRFHVQDAESVVVQDDLGEVIPVPGASEGPRREIEGEIIVDSAETRTYTLQALNACETDTATLTVERRRRFELATNHPIESGEEAIVTLLHFCRPDEAGWGDRQFTLSYEDPDGVLIDPPDSLIIGSDSTDASVAIETTGCGRVRVSAFAEHPDDYYDGFGSHATMFVYSAPVISAIRARDANSCETFTFEIVGDCIAPYLERLSVRLTERDTGRDLGIARILDFHPGTGGTSQGVTVTCETNRPLGEIPVDVTLRQFRLVSNSHEMTVARLRSPAPRIELFSASRTSIDAGERIEFNWRVAYAQKVELEANGPTSLGDGPGIVYEQPGPEDPCAHWTGSFEQYVSFAVTYILKAYPFGSDSPATQEIRIVDTSPPDAPALPSGFSKLVISNCHVDRRTINVWTKKNLDSWVDQGELEHGYSARGTCRTRVEDDDHVMTIGLDDGAVYVVQLYDLMQRNCTESHPDAGDADCSLFIGSPLVIVGDSDGEPYYLSVPPDG